MRVLGILTAAMLCAPAFAQAPAEWAAVAKTTNGPCPEGSIAFASERPGALHVRLVFPNGKQYAEFDVPLASDGSGKAEFKGFSDSYGGARRKGKAGVQNSSSIRHLPMDVDPEVTA
jgi:hypothetical protein